MYHSSHFDDAMSDGLHFLFFSLTSVNPLVRQLVRALPTYLFGFMLLFLAAKRNAQPSATALLFANSSA
jgi:hypothetical protein